MSAEGRSKLYVFEVGPIRLENFESRRELRAAEFQVRDEMAALLRKHWRTGPRSSLVKARIADVDDG